MSSGSGGAGGSGGVWKDDTVGGLLVCIDLGRVPYLNLAVLSLLMLILLLLAVLMLFYDSRNGF